ncbi:MAG: FAD-dependent oxidoreductase [Clostridia bacterium]|nr:FAD-dependent oxidoreductase [Clostridia bacterium]
MACSCKDERIALELMEVIKHDDETFSFDFHMNPSVHWKEGDSSKVYISVNEKWIGKKFSYATIPDEKRIRFTTRIRENASAYKQALNNLKKGESVEITVPSGEFYLRRENRPVLILSNGVGIAAARSLIYAYDHDSSDVSMLASINVNHTSELYQNEMMQIEKHTRYFTAHYAENRTEFYQSLDFVLQNMMVYLSDDPIIYVVGSTLFVSNTIEYLMNMGISGHDIITDGHVSAGSCGCDDEAGCGCGGNELLYLYPDHIQLPVIKV